MKSKGQASVEYLVILAVVLIIALVVVAALGGFIDIGRQAGPQASRTYWRTAEIGIMDWDIGVGNSSVVVKNNQDYRIKISEVSIGGSDGAPDITAFELAPGQTKTITNTQWAGVCSAAGDTYSAIVEVTYDNVEFNITDKGFTGAAAIEGTCS